MTAVTLYGSRPPGCLDHDKGFGVTAFRASCRECKLIAGWWKPGLRFDTGSNARHRTPRLSRAAATFVRRATPLTDWELARVCECLLVRHLGAGIDIRPDHRPQAA